eukprot:CAMPEP_0119340428 /NCGR_PEP_ID=MMETSP1333-20130426/100373_1 /TAXON_ID=418940 /ORGANISM="Scyphosphaera apsteinii, Strain RCC1455" /LENGTH=124 /DNA_ID=CAMNT_0007352183 /DNA_START=440 /DNA_END=811 /DNA_ORIENTATION=-
MYGDARYGLRAGTGLSGWYAGINATDSAGLFINNTVLPDMLLHVAEVESRRGTVNSTATYVDLGCSGNYVLPPLVPLLRDKVAVVRIIRSRYDTVRSFISSGNVPCIAGMFSFCPWAHPNIALR